MKLNLGSNNRRPPAGCWGDDAEPAPSSRFGSGDWSWKPYGHPGARVRQPIPAAGKGITPMATFTGVPPSAAELVERIGPARQLLSGLDRAVLVYDIVAERTIDTDILDRLEGRATEQEALMAARARAML